MEVQDLIGNVLEITGAWSRNEELPGADVNLAFTELKAMLDSWRLERLTIDHIVRTTFATVASTSAYSIGITTPTASDWVLARPENIQKMTWVDDADQETEILPLTDDQYSLYANKTLEGIPGWYWYQKTYPAGNIVLLPVPVGIQTIALYVPTPLTTLTSLSTTLLLPPGYYAAISSNLALELKDIMGKPITTQEENRARQTKAAIKATAMRPAAISTEGYITTRI